MMRAGLANSPLGTPRWAHRVEQGPISESDQRFSRLNMQGGERPNICRLQKAHATDSVHRNAHICLRTTTHHTQVRREL